MSKLARIDSRSASDSPRAASSRKAALLSCDTTGEPEVIPFRPRGITSPRALGLRNWDEMYDSSVDDLRKYESAPDGDDDYRQRMVTNFLATAVVIVLMITGGWVLSTLVASTRDGQDCFRPGRSNCAAIYMPNRQHG